MHVVSDHMTKVDFVYLIRTKFYFYNIYVLALLLTSERKLLKDSTLPILLNYIIVERNFNIFSEKETNENDYQVITTALLYVG